MANAQAEHGSDEGPKETTRLSAVNAPVSGELVTTARPKSVLIDMADRYNMEPQPFEATVRAICMPANATREEFAAFLLVAKEYKLNPLTKEIYAFPKRGGGIVPIVSIDGWISLVNSHPACDGFSFAWEQGPTGEPISCTCTMYRKDRTYPVVVTEYLAECIRATDPWKMKHRMLRHKAMIQGARYAFGFSGIYDEDEGEKIAEMRDVTPVRPTPPSPPPAPPPPAEGQDKPATNEPGDGQNAGENATTEAVTFPPEITAFLQRLEEEIGDLDDAESVEAKFDEIAPQTVLADHPEALKVAFDVKRSRIEAINQGNLFPGDR